MGGLIIWVRNEGYIFIRGSTRIRWDKVSVQTGGAWVVCLLMGMGGLEREREEWVDYLL
jgi:hypothetical protein